MNDDQVKGTVKQAEGKAQAGWGDAKEKGGDALDDAKEKASDAWESVKDKVDELQDRDPADDEDVRTPERAA